MESLMDLIGSKSVMGEKVEINDNLAIVPIYKVRSMQFDVNDDNKSNNIFVSISPIVLLKIVDKEIEVVELEEKKNKLDFIPDLFSNIDLSNILNNLNKK